MGRKKKKWTKVDWEKADDIKVRVDNLVDDLQLEWINPAHIHCFRSSTSSSRAYARIWGLNKVWQMALNEKPSYVIEVLTQHFDRLNAKEQDKVLLHEIAHIPKNFSGSLLPHVRRGKRNFHDRVEELVAQYNRLRR